MPRDREPWFKVKIGIRRSGKMAALPSDSARLGYFYVLAEAKVQRQMGVFDNRAHFVEVLGRFGRWLPDYLAAGLAHEAPLTCAECQHRHPDAKRGAIVIHDYQREQRDPTAADRMASHRGRKAADGDADVTAKETPESVTNPVTNEPGGRTPDSPELDASRPRAQARDRAGARARDGAPESGGFTLDRYAVRDGSVTPDSRARGTTATATATDSLEKRDSSLQARGERADIQALLDRGWPKVTRAQRRVLDEVLGRHDVTGPEFAATVIRATPDDRDPLAEVLAADRRWQDSQRKAADAEEAEWAATKAADRAAAGDAMTRLEVPDWLATPAEVPS